MEYAEQEALISEVETKIERLRALYDQYFMGFEKIEPLVPRKDVDRKLYVLRREQIRNTALRFRFNQIVSRYNTFATHWQRLIREIENGTYKRDVARAAKRFGADALTIQAKRRLKHKGAEPEAEAAPAPEPAREPEPAPEIARPAAATTKRDPHEEAPPPSTNEISVDLGQLLPAGALSPAGRAPRLSKASTFQKLDLDTDDLEEMTPPRGTAKPPVVTRPSAGPAPGVVRPPAASVASVPAARPSPGQPPVVPSGPAARPSPAVPPVPAPRPSPAVPPVPAARPSPHTPPLPAGARPPAAAPPLPGVRPAAATPAQPVTAPSASAASAGRLPIAPSPSSEPVRVVGPGGARPFAPAARSPEARPAAPAAPAAPVAAGNPGPAAARPVAPAAAAAPSANAAVRPEPRPMPAPAVARPVPAPAAVAPARPAAREEGGLSETRLRELYGKLVETKRANNESTAGVSVDGLSRSLRESQQKLREKHAGKNIDFDVVVKDGKAVVRPIIK